MLLLADFWKAYNHLKPGLEITLAPRSPSHTHTHLYLFHTLSFTHAPPPLPLFLHRPLLPTLRSSQVFRELAAGEGSDDDDDDDREAEAGTARDRAQSTAPAGRARQMTAAVGTTSAFEGWLHKKSGGHKGSISSRAKVKPFSDSHPFSDSNPGRATRSARANRFLLATAVCSMRSLFDWSGLLSPRVPR